MSQILMIHGVIVPPVLLKLGNICSAFSSRIRQSQGLGCTKGNLSAQGFGTRKVMMKALFELSKCSPAVTSSVAPGIAPASYMFSPVVGA
jgi:hypothetical protein